MEPEAPIKRRAQRAELGRWEESSGKALQDTVGERPGDRGGAWSPKPEATLDDWAWPSSPRAGRRRGSTLPSQKQPAGSVAAQLLLAWRESAGGSLLPFLRVVVSEVSEPSGKPLRQRGAELPKEHSS